MANATGASGFPCAAGTQSCGQYQILANASGVSSAIRAPGSAAFGCASFGIAAFANPSMGVLAPRPREHCIGRRRGALGHSPRE